MDDLRILTGKVCDVARTAGRFLKEECKSFRREAVEEKHAHDYVSYVDKESEKRIVAAGEADFVICFYNPRSRGREGHLARAFALLAASKSPDTPVGVVKSAGRKKQEKWLTTLGEMDFAPVDMTSLVIVGNKATYIDNGLMITPRGYAL